MRNRPGTAAFACVAKLLHARLRVKSVALIGLAVAATVVLVPSGSAVGPANSYTQQVFANGFEEGNLTAWNGLLGNGSATVTNLAARTGGFGLRLNNGSNQFQALAKALPSPLVDSSTTFWVRFANGGGFQMVAQARDNASSAHMWDLGYNGNQHGFHFFPFTATGSTEIFTGNNTVPANTWVKVEIQYTATATGGARLYINDQTQAGWTVTGNYTRSTNYQRLQLWNDGARTARLRRRVRRQRRRFRRPSPVRRRAWSGSPATPPWRSAGRRPRRTAAPRSRATGSRPTSGRTRRPRSTPGLPTRRGRSRA